MAKVLLTAVQITNQRVDVDPLEADLDFVPGDTGEGNEIDCTGGEILLVWNTHATNPGTVTITGKADDYGRTGSITAYSVAPGTISRFGKFASEAFGQGPNGRVYVTVSAATMELAVLRVG